MTNLSEALKKLKEAGGKKVRIVPMPNQDFATGLYQVEVFENDTWCIIINSIPRSTAEDLVKVSTNRVLFG